MQEKQKDSEMLLIHRAKRGDVEAFSELYAGIYIDLYKFALYTMKHPQEAEDAVSEAVTSAYENIRKLKKEESFRSWIFAILANQCRKQLRKQIFTEELEEEHCILQRDEEQAEDIRNVFWSLDEEERLIVAFSVFGGYRSSEIGEVIGMNPATVRSKKTRALCKMKEKLKETEG